MNRYTLLCRLTAPAILVLTGVLALLNEANILSWGKSWPLYLILWGLLKLAQRAALSQVEIEAYPGSYPAAAPVGPATSALAPSALIVPPSDSKPADPDWRP